MPAPVIPTVVTALPTPPTVADPVTFDARADATLVAQQAMVPQVNSSNLTTYDNAVIAYNSATTAATSASNASTSESNAAASVVSITALATSIDAQSTNATSTTSVTISTGATTFTTQSGKSFFIGMNVKMVDQSNVLNYMLGVVTGYSGATLNVLVQSVFGSGTISNWAITKYVEEARSPASNFTLYSNFL